MRWLFQKPAPLLLQEIDFSAEVHEMAVVHQRRPLDVESSKVTACFQMKQRHFPRLLIG